MSGSRLSINDVTNHFSHLSQQDDEKFGFAPILVSTNHEKVDINEYAPSKEVFIQARKARNLVARMYFKF